MRPTLTLHASSAVAPELQRLLRQHLQDRCGPCRVVIHRVKRSTTSTYTLTGPWRLSSTDVRRHVVEVFDLLVTATP